MWIEVSKFSPVEKRKYDVYVQDGDKRYRRTSVMYKNGEYELKNPRIKATHVMEIPDAPK